MADYTIVEEALKRGYTMDEIADNLARDNGVDPADARGRGYTTGEMMKNLGYVKPETSDVARGFVTSFKQLPQLGYGLLAGAGAVAESVAGEGGVSTSMKNFGVKKYQEAGADIEKDSKQSDSLSYSWEQAKQGDFGSLVDWLQYGIGYGGGQAVQALATAGVGSLVGKTVLKGTAENLASKMVAKEALRLGATEEAKRLTAQEISKIAVANVASNIGQTVAIGSQAFGMEGGEIFGDLAQKTVKEGRAATGGELAKAFGATAAAGALEFVGDKLGVDVMLGKSKMFKPASSMTGVGGRAARAAVAVPGTVLAEGGTEYIQTGIEEYGKGNEKNFLPFMQSESAQKQALDAAGLGAVGGGGMAMVGGAFSSPQKKDAAPSPSPSISSAQTADDAIAAFQSEVDSVTPAPRGSFGSMDDLAGLIESERSDLGKRRGLLAQQQQDARDMVAEFSGLVKDEQIDQSYRLNDAKNQREADRLREGDYALAEQQRNEQQGRLPEQAEALSNAQGFGAEEPNAMQMAMQRAQQKALDNEFSGLLKQERAILNEMRANVKKVAGVPVESISTPQLKEIAQSEAHPNTKMAAVAALNDRHDAIQQERERLMQLREARLAEQSQGETNGVQPHAANGQVAARGPVGGSNHVPGGGLDAAVGNVAGSGRINANPTHVAQGSRESVSVPNADSQANVRALTENAAKRQATQLTNQGFPTVAYPHPTQPGMWAIGSHAEAKSAPAKEQQAQQAQHAPVEPAADDVPVINVRQQTPRKKPASNTLAQAIINLGGISTSLKQDITGDASVRSRPGLFTKNGTADLSELAARLSGEFGFTQIDVNDPTDNSGAKQLADLIASSVNGETILNEEAMIRAQQDEEFEQAKAEVNLQAQEIGIKPIRGKRTIDIVQSEINAILAEREEMSRQKKKAQLLLDEVAEQELIEAFDIAMQEYHDETAISRDESRVESARLSAEESAQGDGDSVDQAAPPAGRTSPTEGGRGEAEVTPEFGLVGQTEEEAIAEEQARRDEDQRKADEDRAEDRRIAAEETARRNVQNVNTVASDNFQLGQSRQEVRRMVHSGMVDMFGAGHENANSGEAKDGNTQDSANTEQGGASNSHGERIHPRSDLPDGTRIVDGNGNPYRVHYQRNSLVVAHPIIDGKPVVSADTSVRFWVDPNREASGENDRLDPIYRDTSTSQEQPAVKQNPAEQPKSDSELQQIGSPQWALDMRNRGEVPEGWYVHGRKGRQDLNTNNVIQMTRDWDVADQYAKNDGSQWLIRPAKDATVLDLSSKSSKDMDRVVERAIRDFENGDLDFIEWIEASIGRDATAGDVENAVRESFAPGDIVNSAEAYDNWEFAGWLVDRFGVDFVKTPDGAVAMDGDTGIEKVKVPNEGDQVTSTSEQKPADQQAEGKIEDFGEKIGGAKKDRAAALRDAVSRELSDEEIASQPLSKIWPKESIEQIEDPFIAAVAHTARAEIPAKPRVGYKVGRWVTVVKTMRELTGYLLNGSVSKEQFDAKIKEGSRLLEHFGAKVALLETINRQNWDRIGKVIEYPNAYAYDADGKQIPTPMVRVEIDGKSQKYEVASVADVLDKVRDALGEAPQGKKMEFEVRGQPGRYAINKKGDKLYRKLKTFDTAKEALEYRDKHYDELVAAWEAVKDSDNVKETDVRRAENRPRTAHDWRNGKDVTPEEFQDAFSFKGVEFGNWVAQGKGGKERQGMLNQAYDALMDLASIIGVPPKAMSLNGTLGLGFGSRGGGKFAAHFEPDMLVINLTKTRGAGSLAHEWFHALDNYFQSQRDKGYDYITNNPENYYVHKQSGTKLPARAFGKMIEGELDATYGSISQRFRDRSQWELKEGVRTEVAEAFADLVKTLNDSPMAKRASLIDKGRSGGYWSRIIERGARSFENYVIHKMMLKGYHNDYLANVTSIEDFSRDPGRYPYLLEGEIQPVAEAFDNLFATIQTKETDSGVAMFNAKSGARGNPIDAAALEATIARVIAASPSQWSRDTVVTATLFADLPAPILAKAKNEGYDAHGRKSNGEKLTGVAYDGKVYLVQENISSELEAEETLLHERIHQILHGNAEDENGKALRQSLGRLYSRIGGKDAIVALAKRAGADMSGPLAALPRVALSNRPAFLVDEFLAHVEGQRAYEKFPQSVVRAIREFYGEFRDWLRSSKFVKIADAVGVNLGNFTQSDLSWTLKKIRQQTAGTGSKAIRFMTAWHGSPHDHDGFDSSKIGTGEGAQAYGWGLYFAGAREVAEWYRKTLSARGDGSRDSDLVVSTLTRMRDEWGVPESQLKEKLVEWFSAPAWNGMRERHPDFDAFISQHLKRGHLYQVELAPTEDELLDWDKPLSEQNEKVKAALRMEVDGQYGEGFFDSYAEAGNDYRDLKDNLFEDLSEKDVSMLMLSLGIRGIKYLDGNSRPSIWKYDVDVFGSSGSLLKQHRVRTKAEADDIVADAEASGRAAKVKQIQQPDDQNHNYVIFDSADIKITAKESRRASNDLDFTQPRGPEPLRKTSFGYANDTHNLFHVSTFKGNDGDVSTFDVYDTNTGRKLGEVALGLRGDEITTLANIEAKDKKSGFGEQLLRSLVANNPDGIYIINMLPEAVPFWQKMGVSLDEHFEGVWEHGNGVLTEEAIQTARNSERGIAAEDSGGERKESRGSEESGRGRQADNPVSSKGVADKTAPANAGVSVSAPSESVRRIQAVVERFKSQFKGAAALDIRVVSTTFDIPARFRPSPFAEGVFHDDAGLVYLVTMNLRNPLGVLSETRAWQVLLHESVGHYGLSQMMGDKFGGILKAVKQATQAGRQVSETQSNPLQPGDKDYTTWEAVKLRYPDASDSEVAQEVLARMSETDPGSSIVGYAVATVRQWVRDVARAMGVNVIVSTSELRDLVAKASGYMRRGDNLAEEHEPSGLVAASTGVAREGGKRGLESRAATVQPQGPIWSAPEMSRTDNIIYTMQDKNIDLKRVQQAIKSAVGEIRDDIDAYLQEELFHGRAAKITKEFLDKEVNPLISLMRASNVSMEEMETFLWARHAKERNAQIAKINDEMPDGGSGLTNKQADDLMGGKDVTIGDKTIAGVKPARKKLLSDLAGRVDAITKGNRALLERYGLESAETLNAWDGAYQHYVPLHREDTDSHLAGMGTGQGYSVKGSSSKRATGSFRPVENILANLALQRERIITRGEKNRVAQALHGLAKEMPNANLWEVDVKPTMRTTAMIGGREQVVDAVDPNFRNKPNVVFARFNGEDRFVVFNEHNERAVRMAEALKNLDADDISHLLGEVSRWTRYFASINTQYNPIFGVTNLVRDVQTGLLNLKSTPLDGKQKEMAGNLVHALPAVFKALRADRKGQAATGTWAQLWEEFQEVGGQTGYRDMFRNSHERAEALQNAFDPTWWQKTWWGKAATVGGILAAPEQVFVEKVGKPLMELLSDYNTMMENGIRLSAYKLALDSGMTKERAASLAKNLTVNFNRKGQAGRQVGAMYAFFNASVQGTARMAETLNHGAKPGELLGKAGKQIVYGGLLLGAVQATLLMAAGFDDEEPPEFVRDRNIIIPTGNGKYISIPMPLGFHVLPAIGRISVEFTAGGFKKPGEHLVHVMDVLLDSFNPIGNAGMSMQTLAPTVLDPVAALTENKDWSGRQIARQDFSKLNPTPGYTRSKDTASSLSRGLAYALNYLSGGGEYGIGIVSPTPDQIEYLIGQVTGGVGRELGKIVTTGEAIGTGEDLPLHKIPLVGRFYGDTTGQSSEASKFYGTLEKLSEHRGTLDRMKDARDAEAYREYAKEHPESRFYDRANKVQRELSSLRKLKRTMIERDADRAKIRQIEDRMKTLMARFNQAVSEQEGNHR